MTIVIYDLIIIVGIEPYLHLACSGRYLIFVINLKILRCVICEIRYQLVDFSILNSTFLMIVYVLGRQEMVKSMDHPLTHLIFYPNQDPFSHQPNAQQTNTDDHYQTFSYHKKLLSFSSIMTLDSLLTYSLTYLYQLIQ